jgi:hypothetical protein
MFSRYRDEHHKSGTAGRNKTGCPQRPRCVIACRIQEPGRTFKGTSNLPKQAGVSTYLALTFGTLLSSQGTDASFVLTRRTFSGAFLRALPFGLAFPTLSDSFASDSPPEGVSHSSSSLSRFPFQRLRLYQILSGLIPVELGLSLRLLGRSDAQTLADFPGDS